MLLNNGMNFERKEVLEQVSGDTRIEKERDKNEGKLTTRVSSGKG